MTFEYVCGIFVQKIALYEIKLNHYSGITILQRCAKFQQKVFLQCRDMLEKPFFRRDFLTIPGAKKDITANSTPVLGGHDQNTSINKKIFHNCYQNADRIT